MFRLLLVHGHTSVCCLIFTPISLHMLKCSWAHTLSCLFMYCSFASIGNDDIMCSTVSSNFLQSLHLLSVSVYNIFVTYLVCNAWSCAAIIYLSVSSFRSHLDSHRNVSSSPISCLSTLLPYWPCITLLSHIFYKYFPNLLLFVACFPFLCHCSHVIGLISLHTLLPL
jgi:hypothetical protein